MAARNVRSGPRPRAPGAQNPRPMVAPARTHPASTRPVAAVVGALMAMYATSPGQTYVVSSFNESLRSAEGLGLAATELSGSYLVGTLLSAACLTQAGKLADRIGPRRMIALAGVGLAAAGALFSSVSGLVTLTIAFFGLRFFGQGTMSLASSHALALRFEARLGSVEGLRGAVVSLAIATAPIVAVWTIGTAGWRSAAWMLTLGAGAVAVFAALVVMDPDPPAEDPPASSADGESPERPPGSFTLAEARGSAAFWILLGCTAFTAGLITAVHFHLQPLLREIGLDEQEAARTFVPFAAFGLASTLVGGVLVDRFPAPPILAASMAFIGLGGAAMGVLETSWAGHAGMGIIGLGHGLAGAVGAPTLARYFGRAHHGAIRGAAGTAAVAGSAAGPYALSAVAGPAGGFGPGVVLVSALAIPAVAAAVALRRPAAPLAH